MLTCQDCQNYQSKNEFEGYCSGDRLVPADQSKEDCPDNNFLPPKEKKILE